MGGLFALKLIPALFGFAFELRSLVCRHGPMSFDAVGSSSSSSTNFIAMQVLKQNFKAGCDLMWSDAVISRTCMAQCSQYDHWEP